MTIDVRKIIVTTAISTIIGTTVSNIVTPYIVELIKRVRQSELYKTIARDRLLSALVASGVTAAVLWLLLWMME